MGAKPFARHPDHHLATDTLTFTTYTLTSLPTLSPTFHHSLLHYFAASLHCYSASLSLHLLKNRMSLNYTSTGPRLTLTRAVTLPTTAHFQSLPQHSMYTAAYRHLFRLRHLTGRNKGIRNTYCALLRRKFTFIDFNVRRNKVLGLPPLTHSDMAVRLTNTVAFVFNSTCHVLDERGPVNFYDDFVRETKPRLELLVLSTILAMDHQAPNTVKYDYSYKWIDDMVRFYSEAGQPELSRKDANRLHNTGKASLLGFLQYEQCVMGLNESMLLCL